MAYGNIFNGYGGYLGSQPSMTAPLFSPPMAQNFQNVTSNISQGNGMIWVQGEAGAKSYLVAAGNTVQLMDAERPVFYIKETGPDNVPRPLRIFEYKEITPAVEQSPQIGAVSREEYETLKGKLEELTAKISELHAKEGDE